MNIGYRQWFINFLLASGGGIFLTCKMEHQWLLYFLALYFYLGIYKQGFKIKVFTNKTKVIFLYELNPINK